MCPFVWWHGARITEPSVLETTMSEALAYDGPSLVEIIADAELV